MKPQVRPELFIPAFTDYNGQAVWGMKHLAHSDTAVVGSIHTQGMHVCISTGWSLIQGLLTVFYKIKNLKWSGISQMLWTSEGVTEINNNNNNNNNNKLMLPMDDIHTPSYWQRC
jgi:hypothetical protein